MHYEDGHLQAFIDGELAEPDRAETAAHVSSCDSCSASVERLTADRDHAAVALSELQEDTTYSGVDSAAAFARVATDRAAAPARRSTARDRTAPARPWAARLGWGRIASAAAVLLVAVSLTFAPVRTFASNLLQVFRVESVQTVTFTQADMDELQAALNGAEGHFDLDDMGEIWVEGEQTYDEVTLAEAQAALDFDVILPADQGDPTLWLASGSTWRFKLDVDAFNEMLESFGSSYPLPQELDGEVFVLTMPAALSADYYDETANDGEGDYLVVGQTRSPELVVPDGVDVLELRDVILNLPLLPEHLRAQLAAIEDWQNTLVIPNIDGTATDIEINGNPAVLVSDGVADDAEGAQPLSDTGIIWNDDGVVRAVGGMITSEEAISLAESMMR